MYFISAYKKCIQKAATLSVMWKYEEIVYLEILPRNQTINLDVYNTFNNYPN